MDLLSLFKDTTQDNSAFLSRSECMVILQKLQGKTQEKLQEKNNYQDVICGYYDKFAIMDYYLLLFPKYEKQVANHYIAFANQKDIESLLEKKEQYFAFCCKLFVYIQSGKMIKEEQQSMFKIENRFYENGLQIYKTKFQKLWKRHLDLNVPKDYVDQSIEHFESSQTATNFARQVHGISITNYQHYNPLGLRNSWRDKDKPNKLKWKRGLHEACQDKDLSFRMIRGHHRRCKSICFTDPNAKHKKRQDWKSIIKEAKDDGF